MNKVLIVFGTRPEIIKLSPVIAEFKKRKLDDRIIILNTNQHEDLLKSFLNIFDITPDFNLNVMHPGQSLSDLTSNTIREFQSLLLMLKKEMNEPAYILAQGDTNTVFASAIVAFLNKIKFAHLEAGLRTFDYENPYPEEYFRRVASLSSEVHFAPSEIAKENLIKEGINGEKILITGNTIIDSLKYICDACKNKPEALSENLKDIYNKNNLVLITCHRRENHGKNLTNLIEAVFSLSEKYKDYNFIWVTHPNPKVQSCIESSGLRNCSNIFIVNPLSYLEIITFYKKLKLILTDSGGIQEEAPSFSIPVIVIGKKTERIEGILEGYSYLSGTEISEIINSFEKHLTDNIDIVKNPYGDGHASARIVDYFERQFPD